MPADPTDLDGAAVSEVIARVAMCGECITRAIGIPRWRVAEALGRLAASVKVDSKTRR
jgi:hypothetical protein